MAQAKNFEGLSVGANLNMVKTGFELSVGSTTLSWSDNDTYGSADIRYNIVLNDTTVLGVGTTLGLGGTKAGDIGGYTLKAKNINTLYAAPGITLSDATLMYAKIGVIYADGTIAGATESSSAFDGTLFGGGFRHAINKNLYAQVEFVQTDFNSKKAQLTSGRPTQSGVSLGLGYRF